jgi:hypothetical protein
VGLVTGQYVAGTVSTVIFSQPPGGSVVTMTSDTSSGSTAYVGAGTVVTALNGIPLVAGGAISWASFAGSSGQAVSVITSGGTTATVGWIISTNK